MLDSQSLITVKPLIRGQCDEAIPQGAANQFEMWLDQSLFVLVLYKGYIVLIQRKTDLTIFQIGLQLPVHRTLQIAFVRE